MNIIKLGEVKAVTSAEMIEKAGLGWKVKQSPITFQSNGLKVYPERLVNYRDDSGEPLGIVGENYKVVQNSTAFAFLDSLIGDSVESFIEAGSYKGGAVVYIRVKISGSLIFAGNENDVGEKFIDFKTSHDGSICLSAHLVALRLICKNGLMGFKKLAGAARRHTPNLNLESIRESIGLMNSQFSLMEDLSRKMASEHFDPSYFPKVLQEIGVIPNSANKSKATTRALNIIDEVTSRFYNGEGSSLVGSKGTRWGAYNAITEYVDHFRGSDSRRKESAFIGSGSTIKQNALEVLSR